MSNMMTKNAILELNRIIQGAAQAGSAEEQVQLIVDAISDVIATDVCSLYRQNADKDMALIASHGLAKGHPFIIPVNRGLVGRVAQSRHSINVINPERLPDYYYVAGSNEEQFHSFCGVPLVHRGDVIGVLVVQSRRAESLAAEQEAFLTTLATHLALLLASLPAQLSATPQLNNRRQGISGAPGIAIGKASIRQKAGLASVMDTPCEHIGEELAQWLTLKAIVIDELKEERLIVEQALGESLATIIDAYKMLLEDPSFDKRVTDEIHTGKPLPWALKQTVSYFSEQFAAMEDPYLRARHEDIDQLGDKLYRAWLGRTATALEESDDQSAIILVGHQLSVSDIVSLPAERLAGIVCCAGAALSHISVFANALGIPAVMGIGEISIQQGETLIVDGDNGLLIMAPTTAVTAEYRDIIHSRRAFERRIHAAGHDLPAMTSDGIRVTLMANSGLQADLKPGLNNGAEGIGLYRTEIPFMVRDSLPSEAEQVAVYREVINAYRNKPVYIRTLDIGGDKPLPYLPLVKEENPALGWRGIRFTLDNLQLLMTQFRAVMKAAAGQDNVHLLLPMIGSTSELDKCIELLDESFNQLLTEGETICRPPLGIMVEVPSSISLLPFWRNKLDFISIGSNDLSQYLLALDRNNPLVGKLYDPLHPAVIHELLRIVRSARDCGLPVSLCGEIASDPIAVLLLLGMGIRQLSMSSSKLPLIKWLVRATSISDAEAFLAQALTMDNAQAIRASSAILLQKAGVNHDA